MPTVHLARVLKDMGTSSVGDLLRRTRSSDKSVFRAAQAVAIDNLYQKNAGYRGPFGFPLGDVEFAGSVGTRQYAGGRIGFPRDRPEGGEEFTVCKVRFVGFHCIAESDVDQWPSGSDEPYFIIGVAGANGSKTTRFGPYEKINTGTNRFEVADVLSEDDEITPPIVIGVVAMESDSGSPEEAEDKVRKVIEGLEKKFDQAVGSFSGVSTSNHVLPDWTRDILIGWLPEGIAALFGLGDDEIGKMPVVIFDNKADLKAWRAPAILGKHGQNEYNIVINVDGGSEGQYNLYFKCDLFKLKGKAILSTS